MVVGDIVEGIVQMIYLGLLSHVIAKETAGHKKILFFKMATGNIENMFTFILPKV